MSPIRPCACIVYCELFIQDLCRAKIMILLSINVNQHKKYPKVKIVLQANNNLCNGFSFVWLAFRSCSFQCPINLFSCNEIKQENLKSFGTKYRPLWALIQNEYSLPPCFADDVWRVRHSHLKPPVVFIVLDHIHEVASQCFQEVGRVHLCLDLQSGTQAGKGWGEKERKEGRRKTREEEEMKIGAKLH